MKDKNELVLKHTKVFTKNLKAIDDGYKIIINEGSSRSSKTWSIFMIMYGLCLKYKTRIIVLRDTIKSCRDIIETDFQEWLSDPKNRSVELKEGKITDDEFRLFTQRENLLQTLKVNNTKGKYTFSNKSTIYFSGADAGNDVIGAKYDYVWVNEPYDFNQEVVKHLLKRLKECLFIDWNPKQSHYIEKFKNRDDCITIHSTFEDNSFLEESVRQELLNAKPLLDKYFDFPVEHYALMDKEEVISDLKKIGKSEIIIEDILRRCSNERQGTANEFDWQVYGLGLKAELPNKVYKDWQEINEDEFDSIPTKSFFGLDFGEESPTAVVECKYTEGCLYLHEKIYRQGKNIKDLGKELKSRGIKKKNILICDTGDKGVDIINGLREKGFEAMRARKGRGSISSGIYFIRRQKVYYTSSSSNIRREYDGYKLQEDRYGEVIDLEPVGKDDHIMDAIRYASLWIQYEYMLE